MAPRYDIFLSYNSRDQTAVREIHEKLKSRGLKPWLDQEALTPGRLWQAEAEEGLKSGRAAAVFIGPSGIGPWENLEMRVLLTRAAQEGLPLVPVFLPGAPDKPELPGFLAEFGWVDLRGGITEEGIEKLVRGIPRTRKRSNSPAKPVNFGPPPLHNLPYPPLGDLLKGRDDELRKLTESLEVGGQTAIVQHQTLYGLGGIGKTRLAVEYAWAFGSQYRAAFFVRADSPKVLRSGLAALARADLLDLEEQAAEEGTVHEVLGWLKKNPGWLLILDNVDSPEAEAAVLALLPTLTCGRILITSRLRSWPPWVHTQPLDTISLPEAQTFLLERTDRGRCKAADDPDRAQELAEMLAGLPLALEQAGAYIVHTRLSFSKYLEIWEEERKRVLEWHDEALMGYPASVAATWKTSFDRLKPTAATLLRLCAFLAPDPIPEEMFESGKEIVEGACELLRSETGQEDRSDSIHEALANLESYSLISRQEKTFTVHRVVQEVVEGRIPPEGRKDWIGGSLRIVKGYAPSSPWNIHTWPVWTGLRPHAAKIVLLADEVGLRYPTSRLMNDLGQYLHERGLYVEAEPLKRRSLAINEAALGTDHPNITGDLTNLAELLKDTNRLPEAEQLIRRTLAIDEATLGSEHPEVATDLNNLALLLQETNRFSEAEPLMRRALDIGEASLGTYHPTVAARLNNLAVLLLKTNRLGEAEPLLRRALAIDEAALGREHPSVATDLNNLAQLLQDTNRLSEAEPLMRRAVAMDERSLGPDHPKTKITQENLFLLLAKIAGQKDPSGL